MTTTRLTSLMKPQLSRNLGSTRPNFPAGRMLIVTDQNIP